MKMSTSMNANQFWGHGREVKTPALLKPKVSATRKSKPSYSALIYMSGIIQPRGNS
jgi:hypothetical protein